MARIAAMNAALSAPAPAAPALAPAPAAPAAPSDNFTDFWSGPPDEWNCSKVIRGDTDISVAFRAYDSTRKFEAAFSNWMAFMRIADPTGVTIGDLNAYFAEDAVPRPEFDKDTKKPRRIALASDRDFPFYESVLLTDLLDDGQDEGKRHITFYFCFTDVQLVNSEGGFVE